nr:type II toxin-antitoxin system RelE/ParE family toxin [Veillonella intestinalis]
MDVTYRTKKLEKVCTEGKEAKKTYGEEMSAKIFQRIKELKHSDNVETLIKFSVGRCHSLKGQLEGHYAMDLIHPYRLVFRKHEEKLDVVIIISIEDYHK